VKVKNFQNLKSDYLNLKVKIFRKLKSETKLSKSNVALEIMVKDWGGNNELKHEN
jgi:hypothetical protein